MKKISVILLAGLLVLAMTAGCAQNQPNGSQADFSDVSVDSVPSADSTPSADGTTSTAGASDATSNVDATTGTRKEPATTAKTTSKTSSKGSTTTALDMDALFGTTTTKLSVTPKRDSKETAMLINNRLKTKSTKVKSERSIVYYPTASDEYKFSHGVTMAIFKGKVYVTWQNSRDAESDCGQRAAYAYSSDLSMNSWSKVLTLPDGDTEMGVNSEQVKGGQVYAADGKLYATVQGSEWETTNMLGPNTRPPTDEQRINVWNKRYVSTDGVNWKLANDGGAEWRELINFVTTRYLRIYNDGTLWVTDDPTGITGRKTGYHRGQAFSNVIKKNNISMLCWPTCYQIADGTIRCMWRTQSGIMMMSESYDNGVTFTEPAKTNFTNGRAKFRFGNLPDGRAFCIYNPETDRNPLVIAIAEDKEGLNFNKEYIIRDEATSIKFEGMFKADGYAYPEYVIEGDYLYVAYSVNKEGVEVTRIKLSDLK